MGAACNRVVAAVAPTEVIWGNCLPCQLLAAK